MRLAYAPYMLHFKQPSGTSRGVLTEKPTYFLKLWEESDPTNFGIGEASVFPGLSPEADGRYEYKIVELLANIAIGRPTDLSRYPSLQFGLEQAIRDFTGGCRRLYFPSAFTSGDKSLTINGLIWMGRLDEMRRRIEDKLQEGFKCIKIKIGALDWDSELRLLTELRAAHPASQLELRVDANGGFSVEEAPEILEQLGKLDIHSIEQPIKAGQRKVLAELCRNSPVPIALDEELIGIYSDEERALLLDEVKAAYIILKPTLCGAFSGTSAWIREAESRSIGWWITSALESNIGLNALTQFTASLNVSMPQGLGTGGLYTDNIPSPLLLEGENLCYHPTLETSLAMADAISKLDWRE